jgi:hypothetical protein
MKKIKTLVFLTVELAALVFAVCGCGAAWRSPVELSPETLGTLEPYLARWSTMVPVDAREEIESVVSHLKDTLGIEYLSLGHYRELTYESDIYIMVVVLEGFYGWSRGYLYVPDGSLLESSSRLEVKRINEYWYKYDDWE